MAVILDGKVMADELAVKQIEQVEQLKAKGVVPGLAVVLVGENPASQVYVKHKGLACDRLGIYSRTIRMPEDTDQETLHQVIDELNQDPKIHGLLVQLPLPEHIDEALALARILPHKDVDGFHIENAGRLFTGQQAVVACTPKAVLYMLKQAGIELSGKEAVVVGRSNIVGKPVAMLLLNENCTTTICHSRTRDLAEQLRRADIVVAAIGRPRMITADMIKPGAAVIDVGINRVNGKLVGDVDYEPIREIAGWITPVPGGVGKMTISMLMQNTLEAACRGMC